MYVQLVCDEYVAFVEVLAQSVLHPKNELSSNHLYCRCYTSDMPKTFVYPSMAEAHTF